VGVGVRWICDRLPDSADGTEKTARSLESRTRLSRPSRVTIALLVTGIPPLGFTVALFVLGGIPDSIAPPLTIAFLLIPMVIFLPLFGFVILRRTVRRGRGMMKALVLDCPICDLTIPHSGLRDVRRLRREHFATVHPEFFRHEVWVNKLIVAYWAGLVPIAIASTVWFLANDYALSLIGFLVILPLLYIPNRFLQKQVGKFRRQWIDNPSTSSGTNGTES